MKIEAIRCIIVSWRFTTNAYKHQKRIASRVNGLQYLQANPMSCKLESVPNIKKCILLMVGRDENRANRIKQHSPHKSIERYYDS